MKRGEMAIRRVFAGRLIGVAACLGVGIVLAACSSGTGDSSAPPPTRTLIPPTSTLVPTDSPSVPTPTDLPAPAMLVPSPVQTEEFGVPVVLQTLIDQTSTDLVQTQGITLDDVRVLSVDSFTWDDPAWRCASGFDAGFSAPDTGLGYRIVFTDGYRAYVYYASQSDDSGGYGLCADRAWLTHDGDPVVDDPVAAAMVALALPDAARRLGVDQGDLRLVSLLSLTWPDSSLGCPKPGADYTDDSTPGYRLVLRAGENTILYHTSSRQVVVCTPDEEILPGMLRSALTVPTPTPAE